MRVTSVTGFEGRGDYGYLMVHGFKLEYEDGQAQMFGETGGVQSDQFTMKAGEFIVGIKCNYYRGSWRGCTFVTSSGRTSSYGEGMGGMVGTVDATVEELMAQDGNHIVGVAMTDGKPTGIIEAPMEVNFTTKLMNRMTAPMVICFMRFAGFGALAFGPLELLLHLMVIWYPDVANLHNKVSDGYTTLVAVPGCEMPPEQSYSCDTLLSASKITFAVLACGTTGVIHLKKEVACWKLWLWKAMTIYQTVLIPMSIVATLWHFAMHMGPFGSPQERYQCYEALMVGGPWIFNVQFFACKLLMLAIIQNSQGVSPPNPLVDLSKNLLAMDAVDENTMQQGKFSALLACFLSTVAPYLPLMLPIVISHMIPGVFIFFPILGAIALGAALVQWRVGVPTLSANALGEVELTGGLQVLPLMAATTIIMQLAVYMQIYYYNGDGYMNSMMEALLERQDHIYWANFHQKVLSVFWACTDFLLGAT